MCGLVIKKRRDSDRDGAPPPEEGGRKTRVRRKIAMLVSLVVVLALVGAGAVWAQDQIIRCHASPCYGTGNYDLIYERPANGLNDEIIMKGGNDRVLANRYTNDRDFTHGGPGNDRINVADGDRRDTATGGRGGSDVCIVDARVEAGNGCGRVIVR
jgi:hypothetical protein